MGNNIDIDLFTQKSEITTTPPDITIEITGLVQLNSFIGLDDTPTYYENGKFFKVVDNKIVYTDVEWKDIQGSLDDAPELKDEISKAVAKETRDFTIKTVDEAIYAHNVNTEAHQSIQNTIQQNYETLDNKIDLNQIDTNTKFDEANKKIQANTEYITNVDNYSQEVNKKLEDLTLEVEVDVKGDITKLREDLTTTNQTVADNYTTLDTKIDNNKKITDKDIADLTQIVQDDYKELSDHVTDLYNKKVDKVEGKELSTNDFTNELKSKLENIEDTAQVNIVESISVDGVAQTIDSNKNVDLHQPVYTLISKIPSSGNEKEYGLTIDGVDTGVTIEIPKDVYVDKVTLKYVTTADKPYTGAKVKDAYLQLDRANGEPIYAPISDLQIHAGQDISISANNTISTVIPIPRKISELQNDNFTVTDEHYVHTDNNFTDEYINKIDKSISDSDKSSVKDITYDKTTQKITITFGDKTTKVLTLEELLIGASYDGDTGNFTFTKANGEPVVVNTPKENFLSDVQYDGTTKVITFIMTSGSTFEVNVSDLVDVYTVESTNSVEMSIADGNKISSNIKLSQTANNILSIETDGLYAKHQDISNLATKDEVSAKQDKLTAGTGISIENNVISNTQTSAEWGKITGTLSSQKDLQEALNNVDIKVDGTTISKADDKTISAIGVKTKNDITAYDWIGTQAEYEAGITDGTITETTRCYITDDEEDLTAFVPLATTEIAGLVKPDGSTIIVDNNGIISSVTTDIPTATTDVKGISKPDGSTITINNGVLSVNNTVLSQYLPLTGGTLTGPTTFNSEIILHNSFLKISNETSYSDWGYNWDDGYGPGLSMRSKNYSTGQTKYKGAFLLWARKDTAKQYVLAGRCDGVLEWCAQTVLTDSTAYKKTEIDTKINDINTQITTINNQIGDIDTVLDSIIAGE